MAQLKLKQMLKAKHDLAIDLDECIDKKSLGLLIRSLILNKSIELGYGLYWNLQATIAIQYFVNPIGSFYHPAQSAGYAPLDN